MTFVDELRAFTDELESLTARVERMQESRGIPPGGLIVTTDGDEEAVQLAADWESYNERYAAFMQREVESRGLG